MLVPILGLVLAAMVIVIAGSSYRRRAGVYAGAGRGAPPSPLLGIVLAALVVAGAVLLFLLVRQ
jgi:hypothetical protein